MSEKFQKSKTKSIILNIITTVSVLFCALLVLFMIVMNFTGNSKNKTLFSYRLYIVKSDSMKGEFETGDLIFVSTKVDYNNLLVGDIITFISPNPESFGEIITHKIKDVEKENGKATYNTFGVATGIVDGASVNSDLILGKYTFKIPKIGYFFNFLKTPLGYILIILLPFLLIIGFNVVRIVRLFKTEKPNNLELEKSITLERERADKLKAELDLLKKKLEINGDKNQTQSQN